MKIATLSALSQEELHRLHPVVRAYVRSAEALQIPFTIDFETNVISFKFGKKIYLIRGSSTPFNCQASSNLADNKFAANRWLAKAGFPVPKSVCLSAERYHSGEWHLNDLQFPLAIKPLLGTWGGEGVLCNIPNREALDYSLKEFFKQHSTVAIEEFQGGLQSYRVLIFYGKVIGVLYREPGFVIGDGCHSIEELIPFRNIETMKHKDACRGIIDIDDECLITLQIQNLRLQSIPKQGEKIYVRQVCNTGRGGITHTLPLKFCRENQKLLINAAKALHLNLVGFDFLCEDINIPSSQSRFYIIEANHAPSISIHHAPVQGEVNPVGITILKGLLKRHRFTHYWGRVKETIFL